MAIRLDHLAIITATDEDNAEVAAFFADVLGLAVTGDAAQGYAEVATGGPTVSLHRGSLSDEVRPHGGTLLQFACDDVRGFADLVTQRGGRLAVEPVETDWGTLSAYVAGPHGVMVELYEWRAQ
ncbi:MAG TPA: VOC family protein [Micromonosporaceae bacterium]|jgi:predicted enzyme related to lactoylglutathione lyase